MKTYEKFIIVFFILTYNRLVKGLWEAEEGKDVSTWKDHHHYQLIYFINLKAFQIDYSGWAERSTRNSIVYTNHELRPLESQFKSQMRISLSNQTKQIIKNLKENGSTQVYFGTYLEVRSRDQVVVDIGICDKQYKTSLSNDKDFISFSNALNSSLECKEDEFYFELNSKSGTLFSLTNFSLTLSNDDKLYIRPNDTSNFVFTIDNQAIENSDKLFLSEHFPPFTNEITKFRYASEFKELTLFEIENVNKSHDYCFSFDYYNIDKNVEMIVEKSNFSLKLIDLDSSYFEEDTGKYKWFKVFDLCIFQTYRLNDLNFDFDKTKLIVKLVSTGNDSNLFALGNVWIDTNNPIQEDLKSYYTSWKNYRSFNQWNYYPRLSNHLGSFKSSDFKIILKSRPQQRPFKLLCLGEMIDYELSDNVLTFDLNSTFKEVLVKVDWIDLFGKELKSLSLLQGSTLGENSRANLSFLGLDAQKFTSKNDKKYRIVITLTVSSSIKKDEENETVHSLTISNLQFSDPCSDNICENDGICIPLSTKKFRCDCDLNYAGSRCQYLNACVNILDGDKTGDEYCFVNKPGTRCVPRNFDFDCKCPEKHYWSKEETKCLKLDSCAFKICGLNEICRVKDFKSKCVCKDNYKFNSNTKRCELDLCQDENACGSNEECLSISGLNRATCLCRTGFCREDGVCVKLDSLNPFVKQEMNCSHNYTFNENNTPACTCFDGYSLQSDNKTCSRDFVENDECSKCNDKQICVKKDDKTSCRCKLGFTGEHCQNNLCMQKDNKDLNLICSYFGCRLNTTIASDLRFECLCGSSFNNVDHQTGRCDLIDSCSNKNCDAKNAICIPILIEKTLASKCSCKLGEIDNGSKCVDKCGQTAKERVCELDLLNDKLELGCKPGYLRDETNNRCYISSDAVELTLNMVLRFTNEMANRSLPKNSLIEVCNYAANQGDCFRKYDEIYKKIYHHSVSRQAIDHFIRTSLEEQLRNGFKNIIDQKSFNVSVISFKNLTEIDYNQLGFKTNYTVNVLVYSKFEDNQDKKISLLEQVSKDRIKSKCLDNGFNEKANNLWNDETDFDRECVVVPSFLYLYNLDLIKLQRADLCTIPDFIDCPMFSHCVRNSNENDTYACVCDKGFDQKSSYINENQIKMPTSCVDVDECAKIELNDCDLTSTKCVNKLGTFSCDCNANFKTLNQTTCTKACGSKSFSCVHGTCSIFWDHYERCICDDGYKGDDCSVEVEKVRILKAMLITMICTMVIIIICVSVVCCYFYSKRAAYLRSSLEMSDKAKDDEYSNPVFNDRIDRMNQISLNLKT